MTRRARLEVSPLEDRVTPVLGGFDVPLAVDPDTPLGNSDFSGIVGYGPGNGCTGFLLDRGDFVEGSRHIVTAAHCQPAVGDVVTFFRRLPDGNLDKVQIPVIEVYVHPDWTGSVGAKQGDIAVAVLASVAPFGVADYALYSAAQATASTELGKVYVMAGVGTTGTGFSGQSNTEELQRVTITGNGGQFQIVVPPVPGSGQPARVTPPLAYNATAADITAAFNSIGLGVLVSSVSLGSLAPTATSRSYEILFRPGGAVNIPRLQFQQYAPDPLVLNGNLGTATFDTLIDGSIDPEYQRVAVNATGGNFTLSYGPTATAPIVYDPADPAGTALRIQTELEKLNLAGVGPGEVTVRPVTSGPNAGTFQVTFDQIGFDIPLLGANGAALVGGAGTVKVSTITDGGQRALRSGTNVNDSIFNGDLVNDFSSARPDDSEGQGDSGGAGFLLQPDGTPVAISIVSGFTQTGVPGAPPRIAPFGTTSFNTRVSKYAADVLNFANALDVVGGKLVLDRYPLTLDMQYQFAGNDGVPDTIIVRQENVLDKSTNQMVPAIELFVRDQAGVEHLYYRDAVDRIDSIRLIGTADDDTFIIEPGVSKVVSVDGGFGNDTVIGPGVDTLWTITGAGAGTGDTASTDFDFKNIENVVGGAGRDTFRFSATGSIPGSINGGAGADTIDLASRTSSAIRLLGLGTTDGFQGDLPTVPASAVGGFNNIDGYVGYQFGTVVSVQGLDTPGTFTQAGATGGYQDGPSGRVLTYLNVNRLAGGAANDTFNVRATAGPLTVDGGAGDDVFSFASDAPTNAANGGTLGGAVTIVGGAGTDSARMNGTAADEAVTAKVSGPLAGTVAGLSQPVSFDTLEDFLFDGRGGTNSFVAQDTSNTVLGTAADPGSGIVYSPTGPTGGRARVNGVKVGGTNLTGGFTVNGDPTGAGAKDVLVVIGTSAPGLVSAFGEAVVGDGRDQIVVTDTAVSITSLTAGPLLPVKIGYTPSGTQAFTTLYVGGGNEAGNQGDTITATTTQTFNLVLDGMLPSPSTRPGDRLVLTAPGGSDAQLINDPGYGPTQTRVYARADPSSAGALGFESGLPAVAGVGVVVAGSDAGPVSTVRVFDRVTGDLRYEFTPFEGFTDGVKVAAGDVNGDGIADIAVGAGPGGGPRVAVFDGATGSLLYDFFAYEDSFRGGVTVSIGDMDQDGYGDLILGTGVGGGPRVKVISGRDGQTVIRDVFAYEPSFRGGVSVATGDVNGDGVPDLVTSAGAGGGPRVVVFDGRSMVQLASFFVFDANSRDGFYAATGDVNGDGFADIIAGSGAGGPGRVRVFSGLNRAVLNDFYVNEPFDPKAATSGITAGVRVASADVDGDGLPDIITGLGPGADAVLRSYKVTAVVPPTNALFPTLQEIRRQEAFDAGFGFGVFVGASD